MGHEGGKVDRIQFINLRYLLPPFGPPLPPSLPPKDSRPINLGALFSFLLTFLKIADKFCIS